MKRSYLIVSLFFIVFLTWVFSVQYSDAQDNAGNSNSAQNQNYSSYQPTVSSGTLNIASVTVNYEMRGGLILNATLDKDIKSLILEVEGDNTTVSPDAYGPHYLELWIPHKLLSMSGGNFTISVNGQVASAAQAPDKIEPRFIVIQYQPGINIISVMGNKTIYDLASSAKAQPTQPGTSGSPNTQNNIQSSTNNNPFTVDLISTIVLTITIVAAIFLIRSLVKKKPRLDLNLVRSFISKSDSDGITIAIEMKIHNKGVVGTTIHEVKCKIKAEEKEIELVDDNKTKIQVNPHSTATEQIKFSLSKDKLYIDLFSVNEITLIVGHTYGEKKVEHVHLEKSDT